VEKKTGFIQPKTREGAARLRRRMFTPKKEGEKGSAERGREKIKKRGKKKGRRTGTDKMGATN